MSSASALMKFLAKAKAAGHAGMAVGKGALEAAPGLASENPRTAMALAALLGGGTGYALGGDDEEEEKRHYTHGSASGR